MTDLIWRNPFDTLPPTEEERMRHEEDLRQAMNHVRRHNRPVVTTPAARMAASMKAIIESDP